MIFFSWMLSTSWTSKKSLHQLINEFDNLIDMQKPNQQSSWAGNEIYLDWTASLSFLFWNSIPLFDSKFPQQKIHWNHLQIPTWIQTNSELSFFNQKAYTPLHCCIFNLNLCLNSGYFKQFPTGMKSPHWRVSSKATNEDFICCPCSLISE